MTRLLSHADQVIANNQLAQHLEILHVDLVLGHVSRQWFITLLFYESVHWVEDQLQQKNIPRPSTTGHAKNACAKCGSPTRRRFVLIYFWNIFHAKLVMTDGFQRIRIF